MLPEIDFCVCDSESSFVIFGEILLQLVLLFFDTSQDKMYEVKEFSSWLESGIPKLRTSLIDSSNYIYDTD